jgi:cytochrome c oxidase subunit 3
MLFVAFTTALLVRRTGSDWVPVDLPAVIWLNTSILVGSSGALELARMRIRRGETAQFARWLGMAGLLGILFLAGQLLAWRALVLRGVYLPSNPHAAFFYVLTALHGFHLLGGLVALAWVRRRADRSAYTPRSHAGFTHAAIYWHFMGAVWLFLVAVLSTL